MRPDLSPRRNPEPVPDGLINERAVLEQSIVAAETILRDVAPRLDKLLQLADESRRDLVALLTTLRETAQALGLPISQDPEVEPEPVEEPQEIQPLAVPPPAPATKLRPAPPAATRPAPPAVPSRPPAAPSTRPPRAKATPGAAGPMPATPAPKSEWVQAPPSATVEPPKPPVEASAEAILKSLEQKTRSLVPEAAAAPVEEKPVPGTDAEPPSSGPTTIRFLCKECGRKLSESVRQIGKPVMCKCGAKTEVPPESSAEPGPPV